MMRFFSLTAVVLIGLSAYAAGGNSGDALPPLSLWSGEGHILPVGTLLINFALLVGIIAFLVRKKIAQLLADRAERFQALIDAAKVAEEKAKARQAEAAGHCTTPANGARRPRERLCGTNREEVLQRQAN